MEIIEAVSHERPSEAEIQEFERRLGGRLPADYREFLSCWNGGRATASTFRFRDSAEEGARFERCLVFWSG